MRLQIRTPGDLQTLELVAAERPTPAAGQVEVAVSASSINFADVLAAFGRCPTFDGKQPQLGQDFAGVVTSRRARGHRTPSRRRSRRFRRRRMLGHVRHLRRTADRTIAGKPDRRAGRRGLHRIRHRVVRVV